MSADEMIVLCLAWSIVQIVRAVPSVVWSFRCRPTSSTYRCPPIFPRPERSEPAKPTLK
jgi:hypothetical protein